MRAGYFTSRSLLSLVTAVMFSVQSVGMALATRCDMGASGCGSNQAAKRSCCETGDRSCCSAPTGCCCVGSPKTPYSNACSCGKHEPEPATPYESQTKDDLRQQLSQAICRTVTRPTVTLSGQHKSVERSDLSGPKAGVNAMLCVWQT